jgi:hypothetical protein
LARKGDSRAFSNGLAAVEADRTTALSSLMSARIDAMPGFDGRTEIAAWLPLCDKSSV